jgi:hypothetical protein
MLGLIQIVVFNFHEIQLLRPMGCDYCHYRNFFHFCDNCYFAIIANYFALTIVMIIAIIVLMQ